MDARSNPRLVLELDKERCELSQASALAGDVLSLGAASDNLMQIEGTYVSAHHARIEMQRDDFYLIDASTNGSFVQTEDERVHYVHRGRVRLWGNGWISLGAPLHQVKPIHFRGAL